MKKLNITNFVLVLFLTLMSVSCSDWIDTDINIDPDAPADVPMNLLLPAIQQSMGYNLVGNDNLRTNGIWMQQFDGVDRQSYTEARYQLTPADVNNLWNTTYTEMFTNSNILIAKSKVEGSESPNYAGVAQVLVATTAGITTDLFNNIPFSEAIRGSENILKPVYDSQEKVYDTIFEILDMAVENLNNTNNIYDVEGDVVYAGKISKWKKAAYSIKARHLLQLSNVNGTSAYTDALAAAQQGFESINDDFLVPFEEANKNPIFQFMEQRGDIRMCSTLVDLLTTNNDPRLPFYVAKDGDGNYTGSNPGSENTTASEPGDYIAGATASTTMMNYAELKFIEAECLLMLSKPGATEAYEAAVAASVLRVTGEANQAWLDANINGGTVTLQTIITQKYIAGFGTNQPYADYRRTGLPSLELADGAVLSAIPTRFPYAQDEIDYNTENVPTVTISDKVWWDQ